MTFDTRTMMPTKPVHTATGMPEDLMTAEFETVRTPERDDILCGKNKICIKHEGSKSFRKIIESYTLKYQQASSRNAKMEVTKEIFDKLQSRRFLKYNEETDLWETLHPLAIRDKIGHALRFSNRKGSSSIRKQVVRRSTSDMTALRQQADLATSSLSASKSMGSITMGAVQASETGRSSNPLRHSTGNMPFFQNLKPADLEPNPLMMNACFASNSFSGSGMTPLSALSLGPSTHNGRVDPVKPMSPTFVGSGNINSNMNISNNMNNSNNYVNLNNHDLSWMMQMPLMEEDDGQVCFQNGQQPHQHQQARV